MKNRNWKRIFSLVLLEFSALNVSLFLVLFMVHFSTSSNAENQSFLSNYLPLAFLFNGCWAVILYFYGDSKSYLDNTFQRRLKYLILNSLILIGATFMICLYFQVDYFIQKTLLFHIFLFNSLNLLFFKLWLLFPEKRRRKTPSSKVLIVGDTKNGKHLPDFVETVEHQGYQVIGMLDGHIKHNSHHHRPVSSRFAVSGAVEDLSNVLEANPVDEIFITLSSLKQKEIKLAIETADFYGVRVNLVPETPNFLSVHYFKPEALHKLPVYKLRQSPLDQFKSYVIKRVFDVVFATTVLILLSPLYLLISLFIYLEDRGPILYTPIRKGEKGSIFKCYKFRTMSVCDDPVNGQKSTEANDPRITKVGKFIRKYDIDELPQFYNVLLGNMSVVGPRPHRVFLQNDFRAIVNEYMVRHYVKPGITGWAQVNGWRGPTKTVEQKRARVQHDLWYIEHWSFWQDLKIIFLTVFSKKTRQNAF